MSTTPETQSPAAPAVATGTTEDRTVAILSYITLIGFIVALIMHSSKKTAIGSFHLRQALGLFITWFCGSFALVLIPIVGWAILPFFGLTMVVFAVIGLIAAVNGQQKPLPLLGDKFAQWFAGAFA